MRPFAVYDVDSRLAYHDDGQPIAGVGYTSEAPSGNDLADLLGWAAARDVRRLWLYDPQCLLPVSRLEGGERFNLRPSREPAYAVAFEKHGSRRFLLTRIQGGPWPGLAAAPSAATALVLLRMWQKTFGQLPNRGPGATGTALLRQSIERYCPEAFDMAPYTFPEPPADVLWLSPGAWRYAYPSYVAYIHCFDRQAAYLAACSTIYPFRPWYRRLRNARRYFAGRAELGAYCLRDLRALYTQTIGWLGSSAWNRAGDPMYRPEWRHAIVARNAAVVRQAVASTPNAVAAYIDAVYVACLSPDPEVARTAAFARREGLGSWQHAGRVRASALPGSAYESPRQFVEAFNRAASRTDETAPWSAEDAWPYGAAALARGEEPFAE